MLPERYITKMKKLLSDDYPSYERSFQTTYGQTLRVNTLKTEPAELFRRFPVPHESIESAEDIKRVPWCQTGYYVDGDRRLSKHPYYYAGLYYLQEPSAMAPASFLPVEPGDRVLDLCAAPGGKTTALAGKLQGRGLLVANDISVSRCQALLKNVEMAGVKNCLITSEKPEKLVPHFLGFFDKILIDAPCSGEGMFRKDKSMVKDWSPEAVEQYSAIQKELVSYADKMLKSGGMILYSTCTYSPEEDEQTVEKLLKLSYETQPLPLFPGVDQGYPEWTESQDPSLVNCRRFWNHRVEGEGQFAALLKKPEGGSESDREKTDSVGLRLDEDPKQLEKAKKKAEKKAGKKARRKDRSGKKMGEAESGITEEMRHFLSMIPWKWDESQIIFLTERAYLLPKGLPDLSGLRVVRSGLYLGDVKKKRFEPSQALAMVLTSDEFSNTISLETDDIRTRKYLRGETLTADCPDGYVLVCLERWPLGWAKCSHGQLKNRYNPGWRMM